MKKPVLDGCSTVSYKWMDGWGEVQSHEKYIEAKEAPALKHIHR